MPIRFDDAPEPSRLVGFAQNALVRDAEKRDAQSLGAALAHANCRVHLLAGGKALVRKGEAPTATFERRDADAFNPDYANSILLGTEGGKPRIAATAIVDEAALPEPFKLYDMRSVLYSSAVSDNEAGAIAQAVSILHWRELNRFCGRCGTPSIATNGGFRLDCPKCANQIFPRTDPVAIMLAIRDDKCLLGRGRHFPAGWYSTLAGFIEPGETIEDAVRRETHEESGIRVGRVRYHASQPWPFPHSLMIGAFCEALSEEIDFDRSELEDCRWFSRDETRLMIEGRHPAELKCPPSKAIAFSLISAWTNG